MSRCCAWSCRRARSRRPPCELFAAADLAVARLARTSTTGRRIDDPRVDEVRILRPQEIPLYVAERPLRPRDHRAGLDRGERRRRRLARPAPLLEGDGQPDPGRPGRGRRLAGHAGRGSGRDGASRVSTEYPELTRRLLDEHGVEAEIRLSYGATEAKIPDIADCVVEITETGRALRAAGLRIIETLLVSYTELIANPAAAADPVKRHAMEQLLTLLQGTLEARGKVLVKLNVPDDRARGGDRRAAVAEVADGLRAVRRRRLRRRDRGRRRPRSTCSSPR